MTTSEEPMPIVQAGDPVLRQVARPLSRDELDTPAFEALVAAMRDVMRAAPGVGLAAPQVGLPLSIAVIEDLAEYQSGATPAELAERERTPVPFHVLVNPRLTVVDEEQVEYFEGCLSVDGWVALVPRARRVRVEALDERGEARVIEASGWYARILQHEIDHLFGTLCIDRMRSRTLTTSDNYVAHWRGLTVEEVRSRLGLV